MRTRHLWALLALPLVAGCETLAYYLQAAGGQLEMARSARPLDAVLEDPATPQALRERIGLAASIRDFASKRLGLPDNASYRTYAELNRAYAVWNVVAAPEFSVEAVKSCFPVAGCVSYRGFFAQADAEAHALERRRENLDVHLYGVPAYSTLGWFSDPLLSSFIRYPDAELARLVFHELSHQVAYAADDTTFNESFAVAVEEEGVARWLAAQGRTKDLADFRAAQLRKAEFVALIEDARARLAAAYRTRLAPEAMRERKRAEFTALGERYAALKKKWGGFAGYDRLMDAPNNALLASISTYTQQVPGFRRLLQAEKGDLPTFYARVKALAERPRAERDAALR